VIVAAVAMVIEIRKDMKVCLKISTCEFPIKDETIVQQHGPLKQKMFLASDEPSSLTCCMCQCE
jgi:hypothetical protein